MKKLTLVFGLLLILMITGCGMAGDPIFDDLYTRNVYPGTASTYSVGSEDSPYSEGWFNDGYCDDLEVEDTLSVGAEFGVRADGTVRVVEMSNTDALPNSLYFSTENNTLVYKDSSGVLHGMW